MTLYGKASRKQGDGCRANSTLIHAFDGNGDMVLHLFKRCTVIRRDGVSQELHTKAAEHKKLVIIDGATHMDLYDGKGADLVADKQWHPRKRS